MIDIHAERCVHQQCAVARCQACVDHCPTKAWSIDAEGLGFDAKRCDGCGLCVAACPTEAITLPAPLPHIRQNAQGARVAWLACDQVQTPDASGKAGTTPCLHAISPQWLDQLAAHGIPALHHASGDCAHCQRGRYAQGLEWNIRWKAVQQASGRPSPLAVHACTAQEWEQQQRRYAGQAPDIAKRRFFGAVLKGPRQVIQDQLPLAAQTLSSGRVDAVHAFAHAPAAGRGRPLWSVALQQDRCTWCRACAELCPQQAIRFEQDEAAPATVNMVLDMRTCIGCGLCVDACDQQALTATTPSQRACTPERIALQRLRCDQCGVDYLAPALGHSSAQLPGPQGDARRCPVCRQGRPAQFNRLVE